MGLRDEGEGWVHAFAPAKVNPWLAVLGKRPDGFHEVHTAMLALDLGDTVSARLSDTGRVEARIRGPFASADIPTDGKNLAVRTAQAALEQARHVTGQRESGAIRLQFLQN